MRRFNEPAYWNLYYLDDVVRSLKIGGVCYESLHNVINYGIDANDILGVLRPPDSDSASDLEQMSITEGWEVVAESSNAPFFMPHAGSNDGERKLLVPCATANIVSNLSADVIKSHWIKFASSEFAEIRGSIQTMKAMGIPANQAAASLKLGLRHCLSELFSADSQIDLQQVTPEFNVEVYVPDGKVIYRGGVDGTLRRCTTNWARFIGQLQKTSPSVTNTSTPRSQCISTEPFALVTLAAKERIRDAQRQLGFSTETEQDRMWKKFVDMENKLYTYKSQAKMEAAMGLLERAARFKLREYAANQADDKLEIFCDLYDKITSQLDGEQEEMKNAAEAYFMNLHGQRGLESSTFNIKYGEKRGGDQTGFACNVMFGELVERFYIKTHQNGPNSRCATSGDPLDMRELFVNKLLENIGVGPEAHFITPLHGSHRTVYIATKHVDFTHLDKLTADTADYNSLLLIDFLTRALALTDVGSNSTNCGQAPDNSPVVVDFRIYENKQHDYQVKPSSAEEFWSRQVDENYPHRSLMSTAMRMGREQKMACIRQALATWNLAAKMDEALAYVEKLEKNWKGTVVLTNHLSDYVKDVKKNIAKISESADQSADR